MGVSRLSILLARVYVSDVRGTRQAQQCRVEAEGKL